MTWTRSSELIFMVIVGGMGSIFGPLAGTLVFVCWKTCCRRSGFVLVFGLLLVALVLVGRGGIDDWLGLISRQRSNDAEPLLQLQGLTKLWRYCCDRRSQS